MCFALFEMTAPMARACSPPAPCLTLWAAEPREGSTDVARNVEFRLHYRSQLTSGGFEPRPVVEDLTGQVVEVEWTQSLETLRGKPRVPLEARTSYQIRHQLEKCTTAGSRCDEFGLCPSVVGTIVSTFVTGDLVDDTKPAALVLPAAKISATRRVMSSSGCGPYEGCFHTWKVPPPALGHTLRLVRSDGASFDMYPHDSIMISVGINTHFRWDGVSLRHEVRGDYDAYVVDQAGNFSDPARLLIGACPPYVDEQGDSGARSVADAGVRSVSDGGGPVDSGPTPRSDADARGVDDSGAPVDSNPRPQAATGSDGGCSAARSSAPRSAAWNWMFAVVILMRMRARKRTRDDKPECRGPA